MDETIKGANRSYHIGQLVSTSALGSVYRAYSRRRSGGKLKRRYYAVIVPAEGVDFSSCMQSVDAAVDAVNEPLHIEEVIERDCEKLVVIAKGAPRHSNPLWAAVANRGYLMIILAALILILVIIRFF